MTTRTLSCGTAHTEAEIISAYKSILGSRQTPHAGPGRKRSGDRCPCGEMTAKRAKDRAHRCLAK